MSDELHVFYNDYEHVIARDSADAAKVYAEFCGEAKPDDEIEWWQEPDDKPLTISYEDTDEPPGTKKTKTMAEWCAEQGRGFLCSTES